VIQKACRKNTILQPSYATIPIKKQKRILVLLNMRRLILLSGFNNYFNLYLQMTRKAALKVLL
ncbi:MAG TPA: hypothetical protein VFT71_03635, partial [Candidatus Nitrosocosmicus sp.]|nr:hypothetical protein [Candidatus Nitrosocosmicus sp.]